MSSRAASIARPDRSGRYLLGALLALPFIYVGVFYAYPIYKVVALSLRDYQIAYGIDDWVGFDNYATLLSDAETWLTIARTLLYTAICVSVSFGLGLGMALLTVALADAFAERYGRIFRHIVIAPMIFVPAAAGVMWAFAYTEHYGWVNHILLALGLPAYPWLVSDAAFFLVMVTDIWGWTPFIYLILLAALQSLPQEPIEAARVDGANAWQVFRYVTFPLLKPVIVIALTIKTLDTYRAFDYLWIMTKGGPGTSSTTLNLATYKTAFQSLTFGNASALAVITMIFPLAVMILLLVLRRRQTP
ncbi:sugar ABC transporter permease [Vineibacter terrae]|uniref:carbohydrate ABC transporter permease n=1 Tax=Vineibacter terrae TaxID=2586908 RepID=UPI002E3317D6|nr:sugar ABC transporter permease [Vineibacter terrae]HEX2885335.1 sugar ABC transporter permease [Vineibacter terrae]